MKVVILAGGQGTRLREETEFIPKPLVEIGGRPILWHIMQFFASHGHTDFVVLVGYKGDAIRRYFLDYPALESDFTVQLSPGSQPVFHSTRAALPWQVSVVETGLKTLTAGRLLAGRRFFDSEPFLLTYGDGLADVDLSMLLAQHASGNADLTLSVASPRSRFGAVEVSGDGIVSSFREKPEQSSWVNIGFMVANPAALDLIEGDEPLEEGPLDRLVSKGKLGAYKHEGFFHPMDTLRDVESLNLLWEGGSAPWKVWSGDA